METLNITIIAPPYRPVTPNYIDYGGIEVGVGNLAEYFDKKGHVVNLFTSAGIDSWQPPNGQLWAIGYSFDYLSGKINSQTYWNTVKQCEPAMNIIKKSDIVNNNDMRQVFSEIKTNHINENYITSLHALDPQIKKVPLETKLRMVTPSYQLEKVLSRLFMSREFRTVHPGPVKKERYPFQKDKSDRLLYLGRLFKPKGAHRAIKIAEALEMPIDIVGCSEGDDIDYVKYIRKLCRKSKYAVAHGKVRFEEKVKFYQNARAVLLPSMEFYEQRGEQYSIWVEPFGNIAVEAGLCGTPCIVPPSGGWCETISAGLNGYYAYLDKEFEYAVEEIDKIRPEDCHERALYFDAEQGGERYLKLYKHVLDGDEW